MPLIMDEVQRAFDREFGKASDLEDLERTVDRFLPDVDEPDGSCPDGDCEIDPNDEPPDLFDDVDDVCRDD